jgi:hypothetical protein
MKVEPEVPLSSIFGKAGHELQRLIGRVTQILWTYMLKSH